MRNAWDIRLTLAACAGLTAALVGCVSEAGWPGNAGTEKAVQGNLWVSFDLSPDDHKIVFSGAGHGGKDLYLLDLPTRRVTRLTDMPDYENYPAFSPDGHSVVYEAAASLDRPRYLFVRSLDGKHVRQLTRGPFVADSYPSFSPGGRRVVFARAHMFHGDSRGENTWDDFDVYVVRADGTGLRRLTHGNYNGVIQPIFTPDGRSVLFEQTDTEGGNGVSEQIAQIDAAGQGPPRVLVKFGMADASPSFFPGGERLAFLCNDGSGPELYTVRLGGGGPECLNTRRYGPGGSDPQVSPDGRTIYFLMGYDSELWQMNADGSGARRIADRALFSDPMHWKP